MSMAYKLSLPYVKNQIWQRLRAGKAALCQTAIWLSLGHGVRRADGARVRAQMSRAGDLAHWLVRKSTLHPAVRRVPLAYNLRMRGLPDPTVKGLEPFFEPLAAQLQRAAYARAMRLVRCGAGPACRQLLHVPCRAYAAHRICTVTRSHSSSGCFLFLLVSAEAEHSEVRQVGVRSASDVVCVWQGAAAKRLCCASYMHCDALPFIIRMLPVHFGKRGG